MIETEVSSSIRFLTVARAVVVTAEAGVVVLPAAVAADRFPSVIFLVQTLTPHLLIAYVRWAPNIVYRSHSTFACMVIGYGGSPP